MRSTNFSSEPLQTFATAGSRRRVIVSAVPFGFCNRCLFPKVSIHEKTSLWLGAPPRPTATGYRGAGISLRQAKGTPRPSLRPCSRGAPAR